MHAISLKPNNMKYKGTTLLCGFVIVNVFCFQVATYQLHGLCHFWQMRMVVISEFRCFDFFQWAK